MESALEKAIDWNRIVTKKGDTQNSERYYISVILEQLQLLGATIGSNAGSQQAVDIRDVRWPDGRVVSYECKKVNKGHRFIFNDTFLKPDVWYIFIYAEVRKVRIAQGSTLISEATVNADCNVKAHLRSLGEMILEMLDKEPKPEILKRFFLETLNLMRDSVMKGFLSYFEFGELFKQSITFGHFVSRPRPNWSLTIPYKPPPLSEEVPHFPVEQSDLSDSLTICTPSETPESS